MGQCDCAKQEDNETPEDHWRKLVSLERNCEFKEIKQEDLLITKFIISITDKELREKLIRENSQNLKTTMDLITQGSYEKRHKQSTIPPALAKEKEKKEEPIQKKQPRNKQNHRKITNTNALQRRWDATTATKKDTSRECAAAKQTDNKRKQRVNYLEATHSEEEESEQEEIQQITQINRILPEKNDDHGIRLKINGKYQNFAIDTGSPSQSCQTTRSYTIKKVPTERKIPGREQE